MYTKQKRTAGTAEATAKILVTATNDISRTPESLVNNFSKMIAIAKILISCGQSSYLWLQALHLSQFLFS
jgi:hypothetical protein